MSQVHPYKIVLADDHHFFLDALKLTFEQNTKFNVIATCNNLQELIAVTNYTNFDLLILDLNFNGIKSIDFINEIRKNETDFKIVCLSSHDSHIIKDQIINAGVNAFYSKNKNMEEFAGEITKVLCSENADYNNPNLNSKTDYTQRELDVLEALYNKTNDSDAAKSLYISLNTFKTHKQSLYKKSNSKNNIDLIKYAIQNGLLVV